jgi:CRP/FNR family cyclic AMP-dependent transcriptional regulator
VNDLDSVARLVATHSPGWARGSFLTGLPSACLCELISAAWVVTFMLDEVLIEEGTADDDVFLLLSSYVKVTARVDRGAEALLAVRSAGDVVGELAALDRRPRSATVRACGKQPVVAARLPSETFWDLVGENKTAVRLLTSMVTSKLRTATRRRVDYAGASPRVRVARAICELLPLHGRPVGNGIVIGLDLTQVELGSLVGVTRPTAERALRELRLAGLVDTGGRRLIVLDVQRLRAMADEGIGPSDDGELRH